MMRSYPACRACPYMRVAWVALITFLAGTGQADAAPVHLIEQLPWAVTRVAAGVVLLDFGRVAFGNLRLKRRPAATGNVIVHFGEALAQGRVQRNPPGSVRYACAQVPGTNTAPLVVAPPPDARHTGHPAAVRTPEEWGSVLPFRWVEVENWPGEMPPDAVVRRAAFAAGWDDRAASFTSSEPMLDRIWELCRYSIKATTFAGVYVDGDRERIAYEADAYLNQISHYQAEGDAQMARDTFDHLLAFPTWPTEWAFHMIFMAHADWLHTGDRAWLEARYERLKTFLLLERAGDDGLLTSTEAQMEKGDLVDWPAGERDGFVFTRVNTVVNAFHLHALRRMAELAAALGRDDEARACADRAERGTAVFQRTLFDPVRRRFCDGAGTDHVSSHANLFPLAFGLVPAPHRAEVAAWLAARGMRGSVYAAHYLLEALFDEGRDDEALGLMLAPGDRSWRHMVESGATITWEAWDQRYKPNQDWNHAWGAAPAHLLPRFVLGIQAATPGWQRLCVRPHPGSLTRAAGRVPTPRGPVEVGWEKTDAFRLRLSLPGGISARLELPVSGAPAELMINNHRVAAERGARHWIVPAVTGTVEAVMR